MPRFTFPLALAALLWLAMPEAMALGFGRVSDATLLGQPMSFSAGVMLDADEYLVAECVSATVFSGDNQLPSSTVRVSIEPGAAKSERNVRVRSSTAIDEPVVTVILQITCPNRLARKFVLFVDPPTISLAQASAEPEGGGAAPPQARRSEPPAVAVAAEAGPGVNRERANPAPRPRPRPRRMTPAPAAAAAAVPRAPAVGVPETDRPGRAAPSSRVVQAPAEPAGAHLKLVPVEDDASRDRSSPRMTGSLPAAPANAASDAARAASAPDEEAEKRARDRERMQALEDSLTKMRADAQATQASLAQLQMRLREAEKQRDANLILFALAALSAALAVTVGVLLWRRGAERRATTQWWATPPAEAAPASNAAIDAAGERSTAELDTGAEQHLPASDEPPLVETTASPMMLTQVHALARGGPDTLPSSDSARASEMSVEELIDLEQQAEFFVVLGQDDAAIDLLMGHLRGSGSANPLAYLKLLEVHRRRDDRDAYERIRERFNRRFNSYAQDWQSDPQQGRSLLDYPKVLARLVSLWSAPEQTMQALEASLLRRDPGSATFDLPAYRELLFLYAVARDLAEHDARCATVDVLLPLDGEPAAPAATPPQAAGASRGSPERLLDVDVDIGRLDPGADSRPSQFDTGFGSASGHMHLPGETGKKQ
jgi:pilus assembly protein FimV